VGGINQQMGEGWLRAPAEGGKRHQGKSTSGDEGEVLVQTIALGPAKEKKGEKKQGEKKQQERLRLLPIDEDVELNTNTTEALHDMIAHVSRTGTFVSKRKSLSVPCLYSRYGKTSLASKTFHKGGLLEQRQGFHYADGLRFPDFEVEKSKRSTRQALTRMLTQPDAKYLARCWHDDPGHS
jgi:hypothetical protein